MATTSSPGISKQQEITAKISQILEDMTSDWETDYPGPIVLDTRLVADLGCSSIDIVQLAVAIEERFGTRGLPFQQLLTTPDGRYVEDIRVSELIDFLNRSLP